MRPAARHFRGLALSALIAFGLAGHAKSQALTFSLPQARKLAVDAALSGNTAVAAMLSTELLKADPTDPGALLAMSTVHLSYGDWARAYSASRKVFRTSDNQVYRFHAARVAATSAVAQKRLIPAQFWLRRAGDLAPTPVDRAKIERNFALLRSEMPWRYRFNLTARPSSNVNGGSDTAYNVIDGVPVWGFLSPDAQALSGLVTQSQTHVGYRFHRGPRSQTEINADLYLKRVVLSEESKDKAPGYNPARLGNTALSVGLAHTMFVGQAGTVFQFEAGVRDSWVDANRQHTALTGGFTVSHLFWDKLRVTGQLEGDKRFYTNETEGWTGTAMLASSYTFGNGDRLSAVVSYTETTTPQFFFDSTSWVGKITYSLGEPVLGMELSAGIGASLTDYPDYPYFDPLTFSLRRVPGGRQDEGVFIDFDARFTQVEYAGFSPMLRVRRSMTDSNVSRFTTSEWAVSVGIESNF